MTPAPQPSANLRVLERPVSTLAPGQASKPSGQDPAQLLQAVARDQDRQAFALLFRHFAPRVKSYLMRGGSDEAVAEELVQETMVSVWRKAALFDARRAGASTWIFAIARNLRVDRIRRQHLRLVDEQDEDSDDAMADSALPLDEQLRASRRELGVRSAMARLSPEQAQILNLSFYEEVPHARIARELGIPLGTVKSRVRLAVKHLRVMLHGLEP
ncbi:MAG TPA: sigma-70 family RNA polymerase sigma factor [Variovorax sp.]